MQYNNPYETEYTIIEYFWGNTMNTKHNYKMCNITCKELSYWYNYHG